MRSNTRPARTWWMTVAVSVWAVLCLSLASWWLLFSLRQLELLKDTGVGARWVVQHRMLIQEGIFLLVLLLLGAAALFYYILQEKKRSQQVREFFAVFTHEVKTSLASLRLQVESLEEDLRDQPHHKLTQRIVKDTVRLELQLENSLFFSNLKNPQLFLEEVRLEELFETFKYQWPEMTFHIQGAATVKADRRALEILFKNLIHNAFKHGKAKNIFMKIRPEGELVEVSLKDDGVGFTGEPRQRGKIFYRHQSQSGSGLGLYLVERIAQILGGQVSYPSVPEGFEVSVQFPQRLAS